MMSLRPLHVLAPRLVAIRTRDLQSDLDSAMLSGGSVQRDQ
jgi:hypothetical protein